MSYENAESLGKAVCTACRADAPKVTADEASTLLREIPDWQISIIDGIEHLVREYKFGNYRDGLRFTVAVGELADEVDHHPSIITDWCKVTVHWWTHKIGGLHRNDFIMAYRTDGLFASIS